jgi:hypothetical protein
VSWAPQVHTVGDPEGVFTGNAYRFATKEESDQYVADLAMRWTAVKDTRSVETDDPVTYRIVDGTLERLG